jgi:hypothetical protein
MRRLTLLLVIGMCLASPAVTRADVPDGFVGVTIDGPLYPATAPGVDLSKQMDTMVASGVENVRVVFDWAAAQPYRRWSQVPDGDRGSFTNVGGIPTRFGPIDEIVQLATDHGLTVLPVVMYAPAWDAGPHDAGSFPAPANNRFYAQFASALVKRYGPRGTFWKGQDLALPIRMWQIWNEPNIRTFWPPRPIAPTYVALVSAAHSAIKRVDPAAKIVLGGMPNYSWVQLKAIYKVPGARRQFDIVAVHPYTAKPDGVITILQRVRTVMNKAGDGSKPILADEVSWPSSLGKVKSSGKFDVSTTESGQARKITQVLPLLARKRQQLGLLGFDYYTWASVERHPGIPFDYAGLFRFSGGSFVAKPAFYAFRKAALAMERCRQKGRAATICSEPG